MADCVHTKVTCMFMFANLLIANIEKNSQFAINRYSQLKMVLWYYIYKVV